MRGTVSVEYVIILLAMVGVYYTFVEHILDALKFSVDVERLIKARYNLISLQSVGYFVSTAEEANSYVFIQDVNGSTHTKPLRSRVGLIKPYSSCSTPCDVSLITGSDPFNSDRSVNGLTRIVKDSSGVRAS